VYRYEPRICSLTLEPLSVDHASHSLLCGTACLRIGGHAEEHVFRARTHAPWSGLSMRLLLCRRCSRKPDAARNRWCPLLTVLRSVASSIHTRAEYRRQLSVLADRIDRSNGHTDWARSSDWLPGHDDTVCSGAVVFGTLQGVYGYTTNLSDLSTNLYKRSGRNQEI
jgi:hypothetical protein